MCPLIEDLLAELESEAQPTRLLFDRIPPDHLAWRPHPKSMTLGELALHVAQIPGAFADWLRRDAVDMATVDFDSRPPDPESPENVRATLEQSLDTARRWLRTLDETSLAATWRATAGGADVVAAPRNRMIRALMFNHSYHHRGQLVVYLRLLDVPLPPLYGPSADENPFADALRRQAVAPRAAPDAAANR